MAALPGHQGQAREVVFLSIESFPQLLFVALCDNVRVNSASLEVARRLYDG